jgi:hypothetical protein
MPTAEILGIKASGTDGSPVDDIDNHGRAVHATKSPSGTLELDVEGNTGEPPMPHRS